MTYTVSVGNLDGDYDGATHLSPATLSAALNIVSGLSVKSRSITSPPRLPAFGDRYIVAATGIKGWTGKDNKLAVWVGDDWAYVTPTDGLEVYDEENGEWVRWTAAFSTWQTIASDTTINFDIKNTSGSTILKGTPVYATGSVGASGAVEVSPADASNSAKMPAVGVTTADLAANAFGHATALGVIRQLDTSAYTINSPVFVASGGGLTATRPTTSGVLVQNVARVIRVHASTGEILVMGPGRTNDVPNYAQGVLLGRGSSGGDGAAQAITVGSGLNLTGTTLTATGGGGGGGAPTTVDYLVKTADGTLTAERVVTDSTTVTANWATSGQVAFERAALTGDVTASANSNTTTIANSAVTYAKIQNVSATDRILGRSSAGSGVVQEITCTSFGRDLLDDTSVSAQRTTLGLGTIATQASSSVSITGGTVAGVKFTDYTEAKTAPTISTGTLTLDLNSAQVFDVSLNANITTLTISNTDATSNTVNAFTLIFTMDGTARTVTWPAAVKWAGGTAPTLTSTNGKKDVLSFMSPDNGTTWLGFVGGQNY